MIDADALLADAKKQVVSLVDDLRSVAATDPEAAAHVAAEYSKAHAAGRTAFGQAEWAEGLYAQVAVAWVLGCVFVRFCEDNDLIDDPLLGGPGIRNQIALDHRAAHLQANPSHDDRHWLREVFARLGSLPATGEVFGPHNPVWLEGLLPSADGARKLREEVARMDPESGALRHDFSDQAWDTRFLGDLYQDLSEHAKKTYALLQTPIYVEELILDHTLDPAISTFGLASTTIIDPTCGSGHFLLGAFTRIFEGWCELEPATNRRELARRSLDAIGGVDLNPFAASIARFRMLLAALRAGGDVRLADGPAYKVQIVVGDSLLHGDPPGQLPGMHVPGDEEALLANHGYESEEVEQVRELLRRQWSAVVGNPPYITVKDPAMNAAYRLRFNTCHGQYGQSVPFLQRFWQLAATDESRERAGYVGAIVNSSFMKRDMGSKLIEDFLPTVDLESLIDLRGVDIQGHGVPTLILLGRHRTPVLPTVKTVVPSRVKRKTNDTTEVWQALLDEIADSRRDGWFSSVTVERTSLARHPWTLIDQAALDLMKRIEAVPGRLESVLAASGKGFMSSADEVHLDATCAYRRGGGETELIHPAASGENLRDWRVDDFPIIFPYVDGVVVDLNQFPNALRWMWPYRTTLWSRATFGHKTYRQAGRSWWEWHQVSLDRLKANAAIFFPLVEQINCFCLDDQGRVLNQTGRVLYLTQDTTESALGLLSILNSSCVGFWLMQVVHNKGAGGGVSRDESWYDFYEFDATKIRALPIPDVSGRRLDLATALNELAKATRHSLSDNDLRISNSSESEHQSMEEQMIALQEELDWSAYTSYGLADGPVIDDLERLPSVKLGERAFEIALARRIEAGIEETSWFERGGITPVVDIPSRWPAEYRDIIQRRLATIESNESVALIERPEFKRRWTSDVETAAEEIRRRLLGRLEHARFWPEPASITTVARLTAEARADQEFVTLAQRYRGVEVDLGGLVAELVEQESMPGLSTLRYSEAGLRKHREWLRTWELQRQEDAGVDVGAIPVPPHYVKSDFIGMGWKHRGKLDVPKERFISYPGAERETDASPVVGWAGWNHLDRARALAAWYLQARRDGRDAAHLRPLLAGLAELVPWLKQWYDEPSSDPALDRPGTQIAALVETELRSLSLTADDLAAWRPEKKKATRKKRVAE